ncbi:DNA-binding PucR family transcriptional regulator [Bacillus ectoiniformans]|uniref:PucR family transcriptional regulator n=1 Tax=Bacillus ectoiniformans TaxID=1494429 RepID=UPI00195B73F1|nr:helix-turn-helix domain-containing protein [Bacillus ectoiniformans]MBM7649627.1 DNA-binding PucR family transcriptional regulator [Bacillus ectoiniformans]
MDKILEKILSLTNIDEITEIISTSLKKPVILEGDQFSLLSYSSFSIDQFDEANQQTIFSKCCPIPILETFIEQGIVDQLKTIERPFRIKQIKEIGLNPRVVTSAKYKDMILGYIWIQENDQLLSDKEMDFLHQVSFHVGKVLYKETQVKLRKEEKKNQFYKNILNHTFHTEAEIKWEAANVNIILPAIFNANVFTLASADEERFEELTETVKLFAHALEHPAHLIVDKLKVVVLIGSNSPQPNRVLASSKELIQTVVSHLGKQSVFAGSGNEYTLISSLRQSYLEALEVIRAAKFVGSQSGIPFEYNKLGVFSYLEAISQKNKEMQYTNEHLMKLKQKDIESGTNLLRTLEVFLLNNCKLKPTAEQLYVHPNTLKYRMKQIMDITHIDFEDFNVRCQLYIDLQLLKHDE